MIKKRKSNINDFRFYPVYQRIVTEHQDSGPISDYKNVAYYPCSIKTMSAMELLSQEAPEARESATVKVIGRYPSFEVNDGDRFFFPVTGEVFRVKATHDPTGRKEYLHFMCMKGAFTTQAAIQQASTKMVVKTEDVETMVHADIESALTTPLPGQTIALSNEIEQLFQYAHYDLLEPGKKMPFIRQNLTKDRLVIIGLNLTRDDLSAYSDLTHHQFPNRQIEAFSMAF